jgi:hypothetical protein
VTYPCQISGQVWIAAPFDEEEDAREIIGHEPDVAGGIALSVERRWIH